MPLDDEHRQMLMAMDEAWPAVEAMERKFRRTDLLMIAVNLIAAGVLIAAALTPVSIVARGAFMGALFSTAFALGVHFCRYTDRRRHFAAMSEAHEVIGLELHYHGDDE